MSLKIKTFKANSEEEIDKLVNDFSLEYDVKASNTNQILFVDRIVYFVTVFYKE